MGQMQTALKGFESVTDTENITKEAGENLWLEKVDCLVIQSSVNIIFICVKKPNSVCDSSY